MCRSCGALIGAGEDKCVQCGAGSVESANIRDSPRPVADSGTSSFALAILGRPATFTIVFLALNVLLFLLTTFSGGSTNPSTIIAYGAKLNYLINAHREWWRFVTPMFLHLGFLHLLFNMYGLWVIGPYVEKLYGSAKFVVFWVVTGIAGVMASYLSVRPDMHVSSVGRFLFKAVDTPSAGASGALFGLIGVLFVFGIRFRHELPEGFKRAFGTGMLPIIVINLFIGFIGRGFIDNAAHLGGLFAGALLALVIGYKRPGPRGSITAVWHALQVCALGLIVSSFFLVWQHYDGPPLSLSMASLQRGLTRGGDGIDGYIKSTNQGTAAFVQAFDKGDTSAVDAAVATINNSSSLDLQADALRYELKTLLGRVKDVSVAAGTELDQEQRMKRAQLLSDFRTWQAKNEKWVTTDGQKYNLTLNEVKPSGGSTK